MKYEEKSYKQTIKVELNLPTDTFFEKEGSKPSSPAIVWNKLAPSLNGNKNIKIS